MKKFLAVLLTCLLASVLAVSAFAYLEQEEAFMEVKFGIQKQTQAWAADGTINEGEYFEVAIDPTWISVSCGDQASAPIARNLNPKLYMSWDKDYVYMASEYKPEKIWNEWDDSPANMWISGALQINYSNFEEIDSGYRLEYACGRSTATNDMLYTLYTDSSASGYEPSESDAVMWYNDGVVTFESRCPWDAFADEDNTGRQAGNGFGFCLCWATGDGADSNSYIVTQLASGCSNGQSTLQYAQITLEDAPAAPAFGVQDATGSFDGEVADNLFDGDENTKWCFDSTAFTEPYVIWNVENAINVTGYEIVTANDNAEYPGRNPGAWTLSGSADGSAWTVIDEVSADDVLQDANFTPFTFATDNAGEYSWFKFEIKNVVGGGVCQISGLNLLTGAVVPSEAAPAVEEVVEEAPAEAVDEVVEEAPAEEVEAAPAPAAEVPSAEEAPQTFDFAVIAAVAAIVSAAGYAVSKKH